MLSFANSSLAAPTNTPLFTDDFETYTNLTPLVDGTNNGLTSVYGWFASSTNVIVQTNSVCTGTNAAMIPVDCSLSNRFTGLAPSIVWLEMDLLPCLYDGTNHPPADTNQAGIFYINSNGNFVVHNGPTTNADFSTNWVEVTNGGIGTNGTNWVTVQIRANYGAQTWSLFTTNNRTMITNNLAFVNPALASFSECSLYNGQGTSYLDNISLIIPAVTNFFLDVIPTNVHLGSVMRSNAFASRLIISNRAEAVLTGMAWNAASSAGWLQIVNPTYGSLAAGEGTNLVITNSMVTNAAGTYTGQVAVSAISSDPYYEPESVTATFVLEVMELRVDPLATHAAVMQGQWTSNSLKLWNAGPGILNYTLSTNRPWMMLSQSAGTVTGQTAHATNTIWIIYTNTADLAVGDYDGEITVTSTNGGGAVLTIAVTLSVQANPMMNVLPAFITRSVMAGQNLTNDSLQVLNGSSNFDFIYNLTTNQGNASFAWLSVTVTNDHLAPLARDFLAVQYSVSELSPSLNGPSNYNGTITVTATNSYGLAAAGSPAVIPVNLQVNPKPKLALSLTNLSQTVLQGRDAKSQFFDVWNSNGFYTLHYSASKGLTPWLVLTPATGSSTGQHIQVEVQYSTANLPAGSTSAVITIVGRAWDGANEDSALNATQQIAVALVVTPFATLTNDAQAGCSFRVRKGATLPATNFHVWNAGIPANAMYFTVSPSTAWIKTTPMSGTSTGALNKVPIALQIDTTGMNPGLYQGTIRIDATDANSGETAYRSPGIVPVQVVVYGFKGFNFFGNDVEASDLVVYRETDGDWAIANLNSGHRTNIIFGGIGYEALPADYSGNGVTEMAVYRQLSGSWYAWQVGAESLQVIEWHQWAWTGYVGWQDSAWMGYVGVPGDYDGDGLIDPGVYAEQSGLWMLLLSGSGYQPVSGMFGGPGYAALRSGDYDGDGIEDFGLYHRVSGLWTLLLSSMGHSAVSGIFGGAGFMPVSEDFDGDGIIDPSVYETSTGRWYLLLSSQNGRLSVYQFGGLSMSATLVPAPGDYDGAGEDGLSRADLGLYDTATGKWYIITLDGELVAWDYPLGGYDYAPVLP